MVKAIEEYDVHNCPSCGTDHQALELRKLPTVIRLAFAFAFWTVCPETSEILVITPDEDTIAVLSGFQEEDLDVQS